MQKIGNTTSTPQVDPLKDAVDTLYEMHLVGNLFSPEEAAKRKITLLKTMVRTGIAAARPTFFESMSMEAEELIKKTDCASLAGELAEIIAEARDPR